MKFIALLLPMLMNVAARVLAAFGFTLVTYIGFAALVDQFKNQISEWVSLVPDSMLQLFYISGGGVALNILFGMLTFIVSFKSMSKLVALGRK